VIEGERRGQLVQPDGPHIASVIPGPRDTACFGDEHRAHRMAPRVTGWIRVGLELPGQFDGQTGLLPCFTDRGRLQTFALLQEPTGQRSAAGGIAATDQDDPISPPAR
jgi:hypothetical protein